MSTKKQKFLKKVVSKILYFIVIPLCLLFVFVSVYLWNKNLDYINKKMVNSINSITTQVSNIDQTFESQNQVTDKLLFDKKLKSGLVEEVDKEEKTDFFDTTLYYNLFNQMLVEFNMIDIDSLTIDSLVKAEMKIISETDKKQKETENISDNAQTLAKDKLLNVKILQPTFNQKNGLSSSDSLIVNNLTSITYTIEFWTTPLRSQAIKAIGNLIIVYGIENFDNIKLKVDDKFRLILEVDKNSYHIKTDGNLYQLKDLLIKS